VPIAAVALALAFAPVVTGQQPTAAAEDNPLLGHWILVVEESHYNPGPPPRSQRRTYEAHPRGVKTIVHTVSADGESSTVEYTANYDSTEYRVTGSAETDGIALKTIDAYTAEATLSHAGRIVGTARRVVSRDGKTMMITFSDARGVVHNKAVYTKEAAK
jgi:histidinol dehydrogenase